MCSKIWHSRCFYVSVSVKVAEDDKQDLDREKEMENIQGVEDSKFVVFAVGAMLTLASAYMVILTVALAN